jgi:hypothetical protein
MSQTAGIHICGCSSELIKGKFARGEDTVYIDPCKIRNSISVAGANVKDSDCGWPAYICEDGKYKIIGITIAIISLLKNGKINIYSVVVQIDIAVNALKEEAKLESLSIITKNEK